MQERRKSPRKRVTYPIPVIDSDRDHLLGHLVDISPAGFMLLAQGPLEINRVFQVCMEFPEACGGQTIRLGVESLWREASNSRGKYWVGFQIIDISPQDSQRLHKVIEEHL